MSWDRALLSPTVRAAEAGKAVRRPSDPHGNAIRSLLPDSAPDEPPPFLTQGKGWGKHVVAPNPAYGQKHGLEWDGANWTIPKADPKPDPYADLARQQMEIQADLAREKIALEREQMNRQTGIGADLRGWLAKKLGVAQ